MMRSGGKTAQLASGILLVLFATACVGFVLLRPQVVRNRFTDSWWHIAVADEVAHTGVFAKDPFFENAPAFAQFGLMDAVNVRLCRLTGARPERVLPILVAVNVGIFIGCAFLAGYWPGKNVLPGAVSAAGWVVLFPGRTVIALGFPFATATAVLAFVVGSMAVPWDRISRAGYLWRGVLLGCVFGLHAFVGLTGLVIVGAMAAATLCPRSAHGSERRGVLPGLAVFGAGFLLVSWRWWLHHLALRAELAAVNAHVREAYPVAPAQAAVLAGGVLAAGLVLARTRQGEAERGYARVLWVLGLGLLAFCLPPLNGLVRRHTSWYMASRMPWLFPLGPALALGVGEAWRGRFSSRAAALKTAALSVIVAVLVIPAAAAWLPAQAYLARTTDYDRHDYQYLSELAAEAGPLRGKTVLSDRTASYYVRPMLKAYVAAMIPGEGSPAVDYDRMNGRARRALAEGPAALGGMRVDAVILDRKNGSTARFTGRPVEDLMQVWLNAGWRVEKDTAELVMLRPPAAGELP